MQKVRRPGGDRAGGFPGEARIFKELEDGAGRARVGLRPEARAPMREGVALFDAEQGGTQVGQVTSGGFGPSVGHPVAMGYVDAAFADTDTALWGEVRGKRLPVRSRRCPSHPCASSAEPSPQSEEKPTMKYTEEHEWLRVEGDIVVVGVTEYAVTQLGDLVFVELPDVGRQVSRDEDIVVIESVKAASDILAPLDGEIVEVNEAIVEDPALVNSDPTGAAWFFKMKVPDTSAVDQFMDEDAYKALID